MSRYADIDVPTVVISGDADKTVSTDIHSRPFAAVVPNAKLIVLPRVGHMVQNAAPERVIAEIEGLIGVIEAGAADGLTKAGRI
jgi:pimeloyl-ACP methyl ester carboxylesterase